MSFSKFSCRFLTGSSLLCIYTNTLNFSRNPSEFAHSGCLASDKACSRYRSLEHKQDVIMIRRFLLCALVILRPVRVIGCYSLSKYSVVLLEGNLNGELAAAHRQDELFTSHKDGVEDNVNLRILCR